MKKTMVIASFVLASLAAPQLSHARAPRSNKAVVIAQLLDSPPKAYPLCGVLHITATFLYRVCRVVKGRLKSAYIFVKHSCPSAKDFARGKIYRMFLQQKDVRATYARRRGGHPTPAYPIYWATKNVRLSGPAVKRLCRP